MPTIALLGTLDTKLSEFLHLRALVLAAGGADTSVLLIDVGRTATQHEAISITQPEVLRYGIQQQQQQQYQAQISSTEPASSNDSSSTTPNPPSVTHLPRGDLITHMTHCATRLLSHLHRTTAIHAALAAGGSGGSSLAAAAMRAALPLGFPKLLVSTVASGDVGPLVDGCDVALMYSVVDIAGWNGVLEVVFGNAAAAVMGMARAFEGRNGFGRAVVAEGGGSDGDGDGLGRVEIGEEEEGGMVKARKKRKVRVGVTMFGVTTPCVDAVRRNLEARSGRGDGYEYEVYVFHATGAGGRAMERMLEEGLLDAVADVTTTEVADHIVGGIMSAGPARLEAAARKGLPCVVSVGAVDMVNFGPKNTVPLHHAHRKLFVHNPSITLMRTTVSENETIGSFIAHKLREFATTPANIKVLLPLGAVSMLSAPGQAFEDKDADRALFEAVRVGLAGTATEVLEDESAINDERFADRIAECLASLVER